MAAKINYTKMKIDAITMPLLLLMNLEVPQICTISIQSNKTNNYEMSNNVMRIPYGVRAHAQL